jgi:hypothetical protein
MFPFIYATLNNARVRVMTGLSSPTSTAVAATVLEHFDRHLAAAMHPRQPEPGWKLDATFIETLINAAFWTSLLREEGYFPKISFALLPPEQTKQALLFERRLPLTPLALARVAPAVERPGIHLGVWPDEEGLRVWGTAHHIPRFCFVLEIIEPGLLVVKYRRDQDSGKFVNVVVLKGNQLKVVDEEGTNLPDCSPLLKALLGFGLATSRHSAVNLLMQLAVSMRAHGRGGTLLIVPQGTETWRASVLWPVLYAVDPPYTKLSELLQQEIPGGNEATWQETLRQTIEMVAGLTAVDGAMLLNDRYELLAFGTKIRLRDGTQQIEQVILTEPVIGSSATVVNPLQLGGTRHLSAAQFVQDQRDALALVASQDGRFTIFAWSPCEGMVHAHRVETLLF